LAVSTKEDRTPPDVVDADPAIESPALDLAIAVVIAPNEGGSRWRPTTESPFITVGCQRGEASAYRLYDCVQFFWDAPRLWNGLWKTAKLPARPAGALTPRIYPATLYPGKSEDARTAPFL
jgi:hypothetical protein